MKPFEFNRAWGTGSAAAILRSPPSAGADADRAKGGAPIRRVGASLLLLPHALEALRRGVRTFGRLPVGSLAARPAAGTSEGQSP